VTRRIKRSSDYELTLNLNASEFLSTPRESQKNWLLNRLMKEATDELQYLDSIAASLIPGDDGAFDLNREQGQLDDLDIMEDWQIPVMDKMAQSVATTGGDILEIGMGRGIASDFIQKFQPRSHTIVECNDAIAANFEQWAARYPDCETTLLHGKWQDLVDQFKDYDGVLFHTYPLDEKEFVQQVVQSSTFAEHFFDTASNCLRPSAKLAYLTNETDSLSRAHQRALLSRFTEVRLSMLRDLPIPDNTRDSLWLRQLVLVEVHK